MEKMNEKANYYLYSSEDDEDEEDIYKKNSQDVKMWDSFQDPPKEQISESAKDIKWITFTIQLLKIFTYIFVFSVTLASSVISKMSFIFMTSHIGDSVQVRYCDVEIQDKELIAIIPLEQKIAWKWAIIFAFAVPELGTFIRCVRICFFKNIRGCTWREFGIVWMFETLHVVGLGILAFKIFPELDAIKAVMLTNCVCFVPAVLTLLSRSSQETKRNLKYALDITAIIFQVTGFIIWPAANNEKNLFLLPFAVLLISFHWWENYVSKNSPFKVIKYLAEMRESLAECRYHTHLYIAPWKVLAFFGTCACFADHRFTDFFKKYESGFGTHAILVQEIEPIFSENLPNFSDVVNELYRTVVQSKSWFIYWMLFWQIGSSYVCYIFSKFACKVQIQTFSFSFPINLSVPVTISTFIVICGIREANVCAYNRILPDYMFVKSPPIFFLVSYIFRESTWIWLFWIFSQIWITRHLWNPKSDKNASTEMLFVTPMYNGLLIDQSLALNRRREDGIDESIKQESKDKDPEILNEIDAKAKAKNSDGITARDRIPQVFVCATMWHETMDEMMEFLKSLLRLDEDQCARRLAMKYIQLNKDDVDSEYYDLESHIFFDDAFVGNRDLCESPDAAPINSYVRLLVNGLEKAAREVYKVKMKIGPPTKIVCPYGGRLVWTLPGRTKLIAHLKDKTKIRHKKRWSQVMYMYYLLGFRIMQLDASPERKKIIAQNTFLLALDGDIDFQPRALHLLIARMKVDENLGAACGRIHPVGRGPMVWYQVFEYAIGHWLQKATEHVIGCVLCSPGCFSLFRGLALMEHSVMKKYTTKSEEARHYVQYDQGEDRWLCTLILKQKFRVEYSAASDAYTHCPEGFNEFFNQRRRWIPSTIANIFDLLEDAKAVIKSNNSISMPFIIYQAVIMFGTIIGPGTIFLMMIGSIVAVFKVDIYTAFMWEFIPMVVFMFMCYFCKQKYQLIAAFVTSIIYALIMMAVLVGVGMQMVEDGPFAPASMFFILISTQIIVTGLFHPQEIHALLYGMVYYVTIPSMYMLLTVYSLFNMNDVSWGTRENPQEQASPGKKEEKIKQTRLQKIFGYLQPKAEEDEGSFDFSVAGMFRCMFCTHKKVNTAENQLTHIAASLAELNLKFVDLEKKLHGNDSLIHSENGDTVDSDNEDEFDDNLDSMPLLNEETTKMKNLLPDWLNDDDLKGGETETISSAEEQFWSDLIEKYLKPYEMNEQKKKLVADQLKSLRDMSIFSFIMINALFVLVMFLLQLNKDKIYIVWPLNPIDTIFYDNQIFEVSIAREYLHLDPLGLCLVVFFGVVLMVQFFAMFIHRFETISEILASTDLEWYCNKKVKETVVSAEIKENAVAIAKRLQKPKSDFSDDEDEIVDDDYGRKRNVQRDTIHQILRQNPKKIDYSNLEINFKRELFKDGELNLGKIAVSKKTLNLLNEKRKSLADYRKNRNSHIMDPYMIDPYSTSADYTYSVPNNWNDDEDDGRLAVYQRAPMRPPSMLSLTETYAVARRPNGTMLRRPASSVQLRPPENDYRTFDNHGFVNDEVKIYKEEGDLEEIELVVQRVDTGSNNSNRSSYNA